MMYSTIQCVLKENIPFYITRPFYAAQALMVRSSSVHHSCYIYPSLSVMSPPTLREPMLSSNQALRLKWCQPSHTVLSRKRFASNFRGWKASPLQLYTFTNLVSLDAPLPNHENDRNRWPTAYFTAGSVCIFGEWHYTASPTTECVTELLLPISRTTMKWLTQTVSYFYIGLSMSHSN